VPSLVLSSQPGFAEVPDGAFDAANPATSANMKALNAAAKFGAVRTEEFYGYYKDGETVQLPISPADGYQYQREELRYVWSIYSTDAPPGSLNGTQDPPARGATSGQGTLLAMGFHVHQQTGVVSCNVSYYKTAQTDTHDGILLVTTIAKRQR
jgi:hypothetical protein